MYQSIDKRRVFFENISPKTTTESLKAYLSKEYKIQSCDVPSKSGKIKLTLPINRRSYGVVFR